MIPDLPPYYSRLLHKIDGKKYVLKAGGSYTTGENPPKGLPPHKWLHLEAGFMSDGATWAKDLPESWSWWFHDLACELPYWSDGEPITAWEASLIVSHILDEEGRDMRSFTWKYATFLFGSWKVKKLVGWVKA